MDTALPGGVFRAGVEAAPVFVPATNVEARSAADTAGVLRGTGSSLSGCGVARSVWARELTSSALVLW